MKKFTFIFAITFCALFFAAGTASAQMKYQNGILNFTGDTKITLTSGSRLRTPILYSSSVYISMGTVDYFGNTITDAIGSILQLAPRKGIDWNPLSLPGFGTPSRNLSKPALLPQSVEVAIPDALIKESDGNRHIDYNAIVVYMVAAMQEQQAKITQLEQRIVTLENR